MWTLFIVDHNDNRTTLWTDPTGFGVSIVDLERVNADWELFILFVVASEGFLERLAAFFEALQIGVSK